jgi:hypothetical protein
MAGSPQFARIDGDTALKLAQQAAKNLDSEAMMKAFSIDFRDYEMLQLKYPSLLLKIDRKWRGINEEGCEHGVNQWREMQGRLTQLEVENEKLKNDNKKLKKSVTLLQDEKRSVMSSLRNQESNIKNLQEEVQTMQQAWDRDVKRIQDSADYEKLCSQAESDKMRFDLQRFCISLVANPRSRISFTASDGESAVGKVEPIE